MRIEVVQPTFVGTRYCQAGEIVEAEETVSEYLVAIRKAVLVDDADREADVDES